MYLDALFKQWLNTAAKNSEYMPLDKLDKTLNEELSPFYPQLLHLIFQQLNTLQNQSPTPAILAQMKFCMGLAERLLSFEIEAQRFFYTLFLKNTEGKSLYDLMHSLKLKKISGIYPFASGNNSLPPNPIEQTKKDWVPRYYSFWREANDIGFKVGGAGIFAQDETELTLQEFCEQRFIKDLNTAITTNISPRVKYQYSTSPVNYYQKRMTAAYLKKFAIDQIPVAEIQQTANPGLVITQVIAEKYRKDRVSTSPPQAATALEILVNREQFQQSPLSKHNNPLLRLFNYHGDTQTVQTVLKEAKKDMIRQALSHPLDADGFNQIGQALRALLSVGSTARKVIRRPMDKTDYTGWFSDDADTKSYKLIHAALMALYPQPDSGISLNKCNISI